jgi:hypothetical protein
MEYPQGSLRFHKNQPIEFMLSQLEYPQGSLRFHKNQPIEFMLSQLDQVQNLTHTHCFLTSICIILTHLLLGLTSVLRAPSMLSVLAYFPSFPSALHLRVSFGLLNNQSPFIPILHLFRRWNVEW